MTDAEEKLADFLRDRLDNSNIASGAKKAIVAWLEELDSVTKEEMTFWEGVYLKFSNAEVAIHHADKALVHRKLLKCRMCKMSKKD